jgi:propanediol dehydratase small subunit
MMNLIQIGLLTVLCVIFINLLESQMRDNLRSYWVRPCAGVRWRRRFPGASANEIRKFLQTFSNPFDFHESHRLKFRPDDRVIDVYRAMYPTTWTPDCLEVETFIWSLERQHGINIESFWNQEITLGEIFERICPISPMSLESAQN